MIKKLGPSHSNLAVVLHLGKSSKLAPSVGSFSKKIFHNVMLDGIDSVNFPKCKTIAKIHLLKYQILTFGSDCFVGLEVRTLVTLLM